ncbi:MAG: PASTA domain-containing protein [Roseburia sp.]|nr:PASTA domain-containing protein [Roseburia sp.]MCM1278907.1 PASTA domain-containing protein [Robinsoniella sp.]
MARCMGCMAEIPETEEICRYCGYQKNTDVKEAYYLLPGKMVGEKYIVGKVLGYGGFGVTYIGWDTVLNRKVAIKEYLPSDFATRSYGTKSLTVFSGEATVQFEAGLNSFIAEAKRLAKFNDVPEIVDIYDCFMENDTGYIIMEFLDGITVKEMLKKRGKLPVEEARKITMSVLRGLAQVHKEGIIHRDIAPDNIFITTDNEVRILDFGAARYATAVQSRSLSVILKPGYAPEEQYRSRGEQGPWTDVYAVGAAFYRMVTGIRPEESIERMVEDHLKTPSQLGIAIDENIENAMMNSLNVKREYRISDAASFYQALDSKLDVVRVIEKKEKKEDGRISLPLKISMAAAVVLVGIAIALFATGNLSLAPKTIDSSAGAVALTENESYVPDVSGMSYEAAEEALKERKLSVVINGMNYSESIEKNKILSQTPKSGEKIAAEETVYVIMSGGKEEVMMPDLSGMEYEAALSLLKAQNLVLKKDGVKEEYSDLVEKGRIMEQSVAPEERIGVQTEIALTVSLGSLSAETKVLTVPDLIGLTREEALESLSRLKEESGFTFALGDVKQEYSMEVEKDKIMSQSLEPGSQVRSNETITITISKGVELNQVPNVLYEEREAAIKILKEAGFEVKVSEEYSQKVSKGLVLSQSQEAGTKAEKGSTITIVVSLGKKPSAKPAENSNQDTSAPQQPTPPAQQPQQPAPQPEPEQEPDVLDDDPEPSPGGEPDVLD